MQRPLGFTGAGGTVDVDRTEVVGRPQCVGELVDVGVPPPLVVADEEDRDSISKALHAS